VNVQFVLNLGYLDFEIVSDFSTGHLTVDIRISDLFRILPPAALRNTIYASRNTVQSKANDYAKQTQFPKS